MDQLADFSLESVKEFMIDRGGRVTNHELVQHFKTYLTNAETKGMSSSLSCMNI